MTNPNPTDPPNEVSALLLRDLPEIASAPPLSFGRIEELNDRHRAIAQMEVMGWRIKDIANELGVHEMTVYRVKHSPVYKVYIKDLRKRVEEQSTFDAAAHLDKITEKTVRTLETLMDSADSENVRVSAAKELFDRQMPKVAKSEHKEETVIQFGDSVQNIALALADSMRLPPESLAGKSDEEVVDLLEGAFNNGQTGEMTDGNQEQETE